MFVVTETASFAVCRLLQVVLHLVKHASFSNRCNFCCCTVGLKIDVLWPDDGTWYPAHVTAIRRGRKEKIKIDYVEGTVEWVELTKFKFNQQWRYPRALPVAKNVSDCIEIASKSGTRQLSQWISVWYKCRVRVSIALFS